MSRNPNRSESPLRARRWMARALAAAVAWSGTAMATPPLVPDMVLTLPPSYQPKLVQTGGENAKVPMKHGSKSVNGNEVSMHVLATSHGNLDIPFKISMNCPEGSTVSHLSYQVPGQAKKTLIDSVTNTTSYSKALKLRPFSKGELEKACRKAMGGDWLGQGNHPSQEKVAHTSLNKSIPVWGQCSSGGQKIVKSYPARLKLRCEDRDWIRPVPARPARPALR